MSIGTRDMSARVTCKISFDLEYLQKWTEKDLEINADEIMSYLNLPEHTNIRGVYVNAISVKCDNCSEVKHISEFNDAVQCAGRGKDYCIECEENADEDEPDYEPSEPDFNKEIA